MVNLLENVRNILIIQLGDIGDVVWATPTLRAVKRAHPGARLSVLVRDGIGCLLAADPSLHRVYEVKRRKGNLFRRILLETDFIRHLRRQRFDIAVDLRLDERGAYMAFASGAPVRVRLYNRDVPYLQNRLFTHLLTPPPRSAKARGAAEQSLALVREMGVDTEDVVPRLWVADGSRHRAREILRDAGVDGGLRWVSINPFSRWTYKEWGNDKWARIIDWLGDEYRMAVVLVGSGEERERAAELAGRTKGKVFNLAGRTTLDELAALLEMSIMNIGVDSAAPHIAAAVGTPTITLYGPSDWEEWAPVGDGHHVIVSDRDCVPCYKKGCDGKGVSLCLEELTVERVEEGIRKALAGL